VGLALALLAAALLAGGLHAGERVNINTANERELASLPHIGPATARKIVEYRKTHGLFLAPEEITNVPGIGERIYEEIAGLITVGEARRESGRSGGETAGVLPTPVPPTPTPAIDVSALLSKFDAEPSIREIQAAAMRFADIHPERVAEWWTTVRYRALLPEFRFTVDRDTEDDRSRTQKTKYNYSDDTLTILPDEITRKRDTDDDWELQFSLSWALPDLLFNRDMLAVADQSEDLHKLREDVLDKVTELYFERRRLQVEIELDPRARPEKQLERRLRLQELTAAIDALTDNYLSDHLNVSGR
jgi:competence ComEA-like helix-hairpin-helix protein